MRQIGLRLGNFFRLQSARFFSDSKVSSVRKINEFQEFEWRTTRFSRLFLLCVQMVHNRKNAVTYIDNGKRKSPKSAVNEIADCKKG